MIPVDGRVVRFMCGVAADFLEEFVCSLFRVILISIGMLEGGCNLSGGCNCFDNVVVPEKLSTIFWCDFRKTVDVVL